MKIYMNQVGFKKWNNLRKQTVIEMLRIRNKLIRIACLAQILILILFLFAHHFNNKSHITHLCTLKNKFDFWIFTYNLFLNYTIFANWRRNKNDNIAQVGSTNESLIVKGTKLVKELIFSGHKKKIENCITIEKIIYN